MIIIVEILFEEVLHLVCSNSDGMVLVLSRKRSPKQFLVKSPKSLDDFSLVFVGHSFVDQPISFSVTQVLAINFCFVDIRCRKRSVEERLREFRSEQKKIVDGVGKAGVAHVGESDARLCFCRRTVPSILRKTIVVVDIVYPISGSLLLCSVVVMIIVVVIVITVLIVVITIAIVDVGDVGREMSIAVNIIGNVMLLLLLDRRF